jgi:biotin-dependent carboxylase-like uncharacterized protein
MSLRVLRPGACSLIVDPGRPHTRQRGLPLGGPADAWSYALGNALVGNAPGKAALEITLAGPVLVAEKPVGVCVFGAPFKSRCGQQPIEPNHTFLLPQGETLSLDGLAEGCRAYVCVEGGFDVPWVAQSQSAFTPLKGGEVLPCEGVTNRFQARRSLDLPMSFDTRVLRCLSGPQASWFDGTFFESLYRVSPASNRMGTRLEGTKLVRPPRELISEPVAPGAVQVTNEGLPIVLGIDGQTIGGYPKIAHVISPDLDILGQLRPGDSIRFQLVDEEEAEQIAVKRRHDIEEWQKRLKWF